MLLEKIPFADTRSFSSFFLDYISQKKTLQPFYSRFPLLNNFKDQIKEKSSFSKNHRQILVASLQKQYQHLQHAEAVKMNIASLSDENSFTITTGHQLNIFTGPLYFIYKIITVINTCKQLRQAYPSFNFVPVYWMASEDHDFEEISYFRLYGKKYTWQTDQKGAVGRFNTKGLEDVLKEVPGDIKFFKEAYGKHDTLSGAVRYYVNALFEGEGLVVIDADDHALKNLFKRVIQDDLFLHSTKEQVDKSDTSLESAGYKPGVHVRDINFFYLDKGIRGRIENVGEQFNVLDSSIRFSKDQIEKMIQTEPEKFSPNVMLRPLYQEFILPNLAYIGGPAEVVYWLQLKSLFDYYQVPFPILMPRNFGMVMDAPLRRKFKKTGLAVMDLFEEKNYLFNHWVTKNTHHNLTLSDSIRDTRDIFDKVKNRAESIDKTLGSLVSAEAKQAITRLEKIEIKFLKAEKRLHSDKLRQIETVKDSLFPLGELQERSDNFLRFYQQDPGFIQKLLACFDPFDFQFNILLYDE